MENHDIITTSNTNEIVTSEYFDIYLDNDFCKSYENNDEIEVSNTVSNSAFNHHDDIWISPSDKLIGIIDLQPPFTSKITRGVTHEGILSIGDDILECEREIFYKDMQNTLKDNDDSWNFLLENEKKNVINKVNKIFEQIFEQKSIVMIKEMVSFYQKTLSELENHMKSEIEIIAKSERANIKIHMNNKIKQKLQIQRENLKKILDDQFNKEIDKIKTYYKLLLKNEKSRYILLKNKLIQDKNDALKAFYKQMEAERLTSTMYVLSIERKKCIMKKLLLEKFQQADIIKHLETLDKKERLLQDLDKKDVPMSIINRKWEQRIVKILQLFLKFISFCLKLLPEQTTFLLDFEKMVILQLNEIQKQPDFAPKILISEEDEMNIFSFHQPEPEILVCDEEPFTLVGDLSTPVPLLLMYGSRETIDTDIDLPHFRVQRQHIYAKCHGYEEIKKMLEASICKCTQEKLKSPSKGSLKTEEQEVKTSSVTIPSESVSSNERLDYRNINRLQECPAFYCQKLKKIKEFPILSEYLDFTEENYQRVIATLGKNLKQGRLTSKIRVKDIAFSQLPFSATGEKFRTTGTQCSSEEDIHITESICECSHADQVCYDTQLKNILMKRKESLSKLVKYHPNLCDIIITDECFDYKI